MYCSWLLTAPTWSQILFTFASFDTEQLTDVVSIYNGSDTSAPVLPSCCFIRFSSCLPICQSVDHFFMYLPVLAYVYLYVWYS